MKKVVGSQLIQKEGLVALVLHAHLPFVRHPEHPRFLEENWFFEALSETYLPLLRVFRGLERDKIPFRLTISLSPTLLAMLEDELLLDRYENHIDRLIELGEKEISRLSGNEAGLKLARMYYDLFKTNRDEFLSLYNRDIIQGFRHFKEAGNLELITTTATHAFLPLYQHLPQMIRQQVFVAVENHYRLFQSPPEGIWLPECGYFPGIEEHLKSYGIKYFYSSAHGILNAEERANYGIFAPLSTPNGLTVFGRDRAASNAIWSAEEGFPGHPDYRDFYRDIGFDLPEEYIAPYSIDSGTRVYTGFKYHAITGKTDQKIFYDPEKGRSKAEADARLFLENRIQQCRIAGKLMDKPPLITAPFDAELFGHWWFEGPQFLDSFLRHFHSSRCKLAQVTATDYLSVWPRSQVNRPSFSSWGDKGFGQVWLDGSNDWIYRHTHKMIRRMQELVEKFPNETGLRERALNQITRELLLSQASDWPFIIKTGTTVPFAERQIRSHIDNFNKLYEKLIRNMVSPQCVKEMEQQNNIFPDIDYRSFRPIHN